MLLEYEKVFINTKKLITSSYNYLKEDIIKTFKYISI